MAPAMQLDHAMCRPAVEKGRADRHQPARARIGHALEDVPREHAAHAVADDMDDVALRFRDELFQPRHVLLQPGEHGVVMELPRGVTERGQLPAQQHHFQAVHDRAMHENNRLAPGRVGTPGRIEGNAKKHS
jgi:hypothetical protein